MKRIASYRDYRRAALAAEHLDEAGFDVGAIRIVAADFGRRSVRSGRNFAEEARDAVLASLASAILSLVLLVAVGGISLAGRYLAFVTVIVGAVVTGILIAAFLHLHVGGSIRRRRVVPARFDVECEDQPAAAEHELARWWATEPQGPPRSPRGFVVRSRGSRSATSH